ncbi:hypothetical protein [Cellvibrio sp. OA-2007]|uniref:hypothetical protein n=1 Tax=Cellvibrio sp. OA-2007 TaxID=529823 RepID=UPI001269C670|nr:hypothetical protein [Cellvibrio sp. OA-2007]
MRTPTSVKGEMEPKADAGAVMKAGQMNTLLKPTKVKPEVFLLSRHQQQMMAQLKASNGEQLEDVLLNNL